MNLVLCVKEEPSKRKQQKNDNKEVRRNVDGTPFVLEDEVDDEEEDEVASLMASPRFLDDFSEPSAFLGMSSHLQPSVSRKNAKSVIWQSQAQVKHTVEEHERRLAIRHEVLSQLALWVSSVEEERGAPLPSALGGGLDFLNADLSDGEDADVVLRRL